MAIKNYTSTVEAYQSLGEIQGALARHGARKIMVEYGERGRTLYEAYKDGQLALGSGEIAP